jgi:hypothetical protein
MLNQVKVKAQKGIQRSNRIEIEKGSVYKNKQNAFQLQ